jgi:hypothetical protein
MMASVSGVASTAPWSRAGVVGMGVGDDGVGDGAGGIDEEVAGSHQRPCGVTRSQVSG